MLASAPIPPIQPAGTDFSRLEEDQQTEKLLPTNRISKDEISNSIPIFNELITILQSSDANAITVKKSVHDLIYLAGDQSSTDNLFNIITNNILLAKLNNDKIELVTEKLFILTLSKELQDDADCFAALKLILVIFMQRKIFNSIEYSNARNAIEGIRKRYHLTLSENIFRHAIGLNAGLGSGSTIYGIATSILLTVPVMAASGVASLVACGIIMNYFLMAYTDEDRDSTIELTNQQNKLKLFSQTETEARLKCYNKLLKLRRLYRTYSAENQFDLKSQHFSPKLITFLQTKNQLSTTQLDEVIDNTVSRLPLASSANAEVHNIAMTPTNSIYLRVFHSKYWGPVLSFFGATGTLFGVTKTILTLAGITTLAGSAVLLPLTIAGLAVVSSSLFALKHWRFNKKSEESKNHFNDFLHNNMDNLIIRSEKLKHVNDNLHTQLSSLKALINSKLLKAVDPNAARSVEKTFSAADQTMLNSNVANSAALNNFGIMAKSRMKDDEKSNDDNFPEARAALR